MKAIIVDDEPKAIELLKEYLSHFSRIQTVATFRNGLKAIEYLAEESVDLVFLDINMPHISGISLAKMLSDETKIIFTTAHSEFAVESYEVQATDYLLKPISLERFTKAMSKILPTQPTQTSGKSNILNIKSGQKTHRVDPSKVYYLEKDGNYMIYHLNDKKIMARETTTEALEKLPNSFIQIYRSYIVNIEKVENFDFESVEINNLSIPIGASFKEKVLEILEKK